MLDANECFLPGYLGDVSECDSYGSSEGLSSHQGNNKLPVSATQMSLGVSECRPHPPVTRCSSGPDDQREHRHPELLLLHQAMSSQSGAVSSDNLAQRTGCTECPLLQVKTDSLSSLNCSRPLRETHISHSTPSLLKSQHDPQIPQQSQQSADFKIVDTADATGPGVEKGPDSSNWQKERWHIWKMMSKENPEALPETLV